MVDIRKMFQFLICYLILSYVRMICFRSICTNGLKFLLLLYIGLSNILVSRIMILTLDITFCKCDHIWGMFTTRDIHKKRNYDFVKNAMLWNLIYFILCFKTSFSWSRFWWVLVGIVLYLLGRLSKVRHLITILITSVPYA